MTFKRFLAAGFLASAATLMSPVTPAQAQGATPDLIFTLFGTGVPVPRIDHFGPGTLVQAGGLNLVFDAGSGAMQRIDQLGIGPAEIDHIFLTHFQSDHTLGLRDADGVLKSSAQDMSGWSSPAQT